MDINQPEYRLSTVFGEIVESTRLALKDAALVANPLLDEATVWPVLNYQYGYLDELNQTLEEYGRTLEYATKKFPMVWLRYPVTLRRGLSGFYGKLEDCSLFIMTCTSRDLRTPARLDEIFEPTLWPIYRELFNQIDLHLAFSTQHKDLIVHRKTDRPFWGKVQQDEIIDVVDCVEVSNLELLLNHLINCQPFKS